MKLQIGDRVYKEYYGKIIAVYIVDRVTKTLAICNNEAKFKLEYKDSSNIHPQYSFVKKSETYYKLETPELITRHFRQHSISRIQSFKLEDLANDQLQSIIDVLDADN
jgi:hypothetical protein